MYIADHARANQSDANRAAGGTVVDVTVARTDAARCLDHRSNPTERAGRGFAVKVKAETFDATVRNSSGDLPGLSEAVDGGRGSRWVEPQPHARPNRLARTSQKLGVVQ